MHAFVELVELRHQDILAEATHYRLGSQAVPDDPSPSVRHDVRLSMLRAARAGSRALAARLVITAHVFAPKSNGQEQTMFTAAR